MTLSRSPRWKRPYNTGIKSAHPPSLTVVLVEPVQTRSSHSALSKLPDLLRNAPPSDLPVISTVTSTPLTNKVIEAPIPEQTIESTDQIPIDDSNTSGPDQEPASVQMPLHNDESVSEDHSLAALDSATASASQQDSPNAVEQAMVNKGSWVWGTLRWLKGSQAEVRLEHHPQGQSSDESPELNCGVGPSSQSPSSTTHPVAMLVTTPPADDEALNTASQSVDPSSSQPQSEVHDISFHDTPKSTQPTPQSSTSSTTCRFVLGIPLLGRNKAPPESTSKIDQLEDAQDAQRSEKAKEILPEASPVELSATAAAPETTALAPPHTSLQNPTDNHLTRSDNYTSSSWWYLGWGRSSDVVQTQENFISISEIETTEAQFPSSQKEGMPLQPEEEPSMKSEDINKPAQPEGVDQHPVASVGNRSSTWYSPWSWLQTPTSDGTSPDGHSNNEGPIEQQGEVTVEELIPSEPKDTSELAAEPINPIQSTLASNRSGWISFFSTRSMTTKKITYEKDNGEMEVMNIDEDLDGVQGTGTSSSVSLAGSPSSVKNDKPQVVQQSPAITQRSTPIRNANENQTSKVAVSVIASESISRDIVARQPSPTPSKKSGAKMPATPRLPNVVLPTWNDVFHSPPRSLLPDMPSSALSKAFKRVAGVLFTESTLDKGKARAREVSSSPYERALPRAWGIVGDTSDDALRGCRRIVVIGVHGWFPGTMARTFIGEPTGTSSKFVNKVVEALDEFQAKHKVKLMKITKIPLEGEGTINRRTDKLYQHLISNEEWMDDLHDADAIFVATHSQGSVVSTHILDRLISDGHIRTRLNSELTAVASNLTSGLVQARQPQRICCLALCGIHLGPLRYLNTNSLLSPYIQYFENIAARELFEFQNTANPISDDYIRALGNVLRNGIKMVYIASLNDQVVGLYSGLFTSVSHPLILRALYIDRDAYHSSDFLSKLFVLLLRIRNAGVSDSGLLMHLSEVTAGSLSGIGHSTPYEELATYVLAIDYLFLADNGLEEQVELTTEPFDARTEQNDYEIPWALRDLIADDRVSQLFADELVGLRDAFRNWHPKTAILREVKRKLQPIQRLSPAMLSPHGGPISKL